MNFAGAPAYLVGPYLGAAEHYRSGCYKGSLADLCVIHHDGSHADKGIVMNLGAVDHHVVPDRYVVADLYGRFLIQRVEHRAVLDVDTVADSDGVHVAAQHGAEPDAALVAHCHVADYRGIVGDEAFFADFWDESSYRFYYRHGYWILDHGYCFA